MLLNAKNVMTLGMFKQLAEIAMDLVKEASEKTQLVTCVQVAVCHTSFAMSAKKVTRPEHKKWR